MNQKNMTYFEHIAEIRKRLILIIIFFIIALIGSLFIAEPIILFLQQREETLILELNAFRLADPLAVYLKMAFVIAVVLTSPVILYHLWAFISPGLYEKERKATLSYIPIAVLLFLVGISFSYFILFPFVVRFMANLSNHLEVNLVIGINEYFDFLFQMTLPFGFLFQLPVIILFLTRLGIINPHLLSRFRKYAYFILLVIAALITPPDVLSHMMVTLPLFLLYEISIWISKLAFRKMLKREQEYQLEESNMANQ